MRIAIHPLFFAVGIVSAFTGRLMLFCITTLTALLHEFAHAFYAQRLGFSLQKITLMPYGAVAQGELEGIARRDEILLLCMGPLANGATALLFVALWWFFPDTYAYTDTVVQASAAVCLVNLLPALPLDGGKILFCLLKGPLSERQADRICRALGVVFALLFGVAGIVTANLSVLLFAGLLLTGVFSRESGYVRLRYPRTAVKNGVEVRQIAVLPQTKCKKVLRFLREDCYLVITVLAERGSYTVTQDELLAWLEKHSIYTSFGDFADNFCPKPLEKDRQVWYNI